MISHATALDLWNLRDVSPGEVHVLVPKHGRIRRRPRPAYAVHVRDLDPGDVTRTEGIPVVTVRRAILDGIQARLGGHLIEQAVETATRQGLLDRGELNEIGAAPAEGTESR